MSTPLKQDNMMILKENKKIQKENKMILQENKKILEENKKILKENKKIRAATVMEDSGNTGKQEDLVDVVKEKEMQLGRRLCPTELKLLAAKTHYDCMNAEDGEEKDVFKKRVKRAYDQLHRMKKQIGEAEAEVLIPKKEAKTDRERQRQVVMS